jgi:hypothetical protein
MGSTQTADGQDAQPAIVNVLNDAVNGDTAGVAAGAPEAIQEAPEAAGSFVEGLISAYLQKVTLEPDEKQCIQDTMGRLTSDATALITEVAQVIGDLVAKKPPSALAVMSGTGQIVEVVSLVQTFANDCIEDDVKAVMEATLNHLKNPEYVKGRLLANGLDIAEALADTIKFYEEGNFHGVGHDFGTLMRKIMLSEHSGAVELVLPEGMAKTEVGEAVANGVIEGIFVRGTTVRLTSTVDSTIDVIIDLHECVAKEAPYFSAAVNSLYLAVSQITTNIEQWQLQQKGIKTGYVGSGGGHQHPSILGGEMPKLNWMNQMSGVMTNIPTLMSRCGLGAQRTALSKAFKSMNTITMAFTIPGPKTRAEASTAAAIKFEQATQAWKVGGYKLFGQELGGLMRDLLLTVYPQQAGRLWIVHQGQLIDYVEGNGGNSGSLALFVGGFAVLMLVGLSLIRVAKPRTRPASLLQAEADECQDVEEPAVAE